MSEEEKCRKFSKVSEGVNEFYTPLYPNNYPNQTECILKLSADYGYLIRVDFRDHFSLEPSPDCAYDFLEIRDGPHGYSDLMGKYCGNEYPPLITSKDRHLWLRFSSDDTLEYKGFRAVFEFIENTQIDRPEIGPCKFERGGVQGLVTHTDIPRYRLNYSETYGVPLDCTWIIRVENHQKIYLFFEEFELKEPNECDLNYVDIFGPERDLRSRIKHFCGSVADPVVTTEHIMHFRFFATKDAIESEFRAWFTAFRDRIDDDEDGSCESHEYDCDDATCIDLSLECNGIKNCRHEYDEDGCDKDKKGQFDISSEHIIIILTLGCALLSGMCFAMCFNCIKKLVRDGRQIHENIRRSREQLEERRSASVGSSPRLLHRGQVTADEEAYVEGKRNGHTCIHTEEEEDTEEEEEEEDEEEEEEESCVEMRDCECQTRDSLVAQRDSGLHGTPPPPPPPTRRPPGLPPLSPPLAVPTPPPPPVTHSPYYNRHHHSNDPYISTCLHHSVQPPSDHYSGSDSTGEPYKQMHRAEALFQMRDRPKYEVSKTGKSTPDVLVTH